MVYIVQQNLIPPPPFGFKKINLNPPAENFPCNALLLLPYHLKDPFPLFLSLAEAEETLIHFLSIPAGAGGGWAGIRNLPREKSYQAYFAFKYKNV